MSEKPAPENIERAREARQESFRAVLAEAAKAQQEASSVTFAMASESGRGWDPDAHLIPIAKAIATAEERGRRRGVEEADRYRVALQEIRDGHALAGDDPFNTQLCWRCSEKWPCSTARTIDAAIAPPAKAEQIRRGVELLRECDEALKTAMGTVECMSVFPPGHEFAGRELLWHKLAVAARAKIATLAPRDSAPADDGYCATCNSIRGTHQSWCTSFRAPRDSAPQPARMDAPGGPECWCGRVSAYESGWCGTCKAPRDSGKEG